MTTSATAPTTADRVFLSALAAWGDAHSGNCIERLSTAWRERLEAVTKASGAPDQPDESLAALRTEHAAESRPDPSRIHATWWVRALQEESEAVRRTVAAHAPSAVRSTLCEALGLEENALDSPRPAHPEARDWALALWSERLVGGPGVREEDAPVVAAIGSLDGVALRRLLVLLGLAKRSLNPVDPVVEQLKPSDRNRWDAFQSRWSEIDSRFTQLAKQDTLLSPGGASADLSRLGVVTLGRLLADVEPQRARWALQHLPYPAAKVIRSYMKLNSALATPADLVEWENQILRAARERLAEELDGSDVPGDAS